MPRAKGGPKTRAMTEETAEAGERTVWCQEPAVPLSNRIGRQGTTVRLYRAQESEAGFPAIVDCTH